eukprot:gene552-591_t
MKRKSGSYQVREAAPSYEEEVIPSEEVPPPEDDEPTSKKVKVSASVRRKRNKRKSQGLPSMPDPPAAVGRDFAGDLKAYLDSWERKDQPGSQWKFNKVLQAWALTNLTSTEKVPQTVFQQLLPYIRSVQGGARDRLKDHLKKVAANDGDDNEEEQQQEEEEEGESTTTTKQREAQRLKRKLQALQRAQEILMILTE